MALWGKTDTLASKPKHLTKLNTFDATDTEVVDTTAETIAIPSHGFATGDAVAYEASDTAIGGLTDGTTYYVIRVDANTIKLATNASNATAGTAINLSAVGAGEADTLQLTAPTVFFVDANEATVAANKAKGITGAGWWLYRTYTDAQETTRHKAECLIAMSVAAADSGDDEDTVTVDRAITIGTQPTNVSVVAPATATFTVVATATGDGDLTYQWQIQQEGAGAFANISGATAASYTTGATATGDGAGATDGDKYRVVISTAGAADATSSVVTLTVTAE
jgi:hypothetical protein